MLMLDVRIGRSVYVGRDYEIAVDAIDVQAESVCVRLIVGGAEAAYELKPADFKVATQRGWRTVDVPVTQRIFAGKAMVALERIRSSVLVTLGIDAPNWMAVSRDDITREQHDQWQRAREAV